MTAKMSEVFKDFMPVSPGMFTVSTPGFDLTTEEKSEMRKAAARAINEYDSDKETIERLVEALRRADQFITNGVELGFIRMPDASTPDPAHETPWIVRAALSLAEGRS